MLYARRVGNKGVRVSKVLANGESRLWGGYAGQGDRGYTRQAVMGARSVQARKAVGRVCERGRETTLQARSHGGDGSTKCRRRAELVARVCRCRRLAPQASCTRAKVILRVVYGCLISVRVKACVC